MKLTLFAALMVAFATETTATSVGHHALDNFDDDAVLFGEIYNFDAPPAKKAVVAKKAVPAVKKAIAPAKKAPAKKADDSGSESDSDSGSDGGADSGSDSKGDDSGSDSDDDEKAAPKKAKVEPDSDSDSDDDEDEAPKKAVAKKMAVARAIKKKPEIVGGKGSLPPKRSMPRTVHLSRRKPLARMCR